MNELSELSEGQLWDRIRWAEAEADRLRNLRSREPNEQDHRRISECYAKAQMYRDEMNRRNVEV